MKKNFIKPLGFACVVGMLTTAYAFAPAKPTEPVYIMAPFKLDEINVKAEQATLLTANDEYALEVDYVADVYKDGNGVGHNWIDVEVKEIKDIRVYSKDGEIQAYVDRLDVVEIKDIIEQELRERIKRSVETDMEWISVEETPSNFQEETKVLILLKETENCWFPESYADRIEKAWWLPQREAFVFEDVEDAKCLITHWMPLPAPPKEHSHD